MEYVPIVATSQEICMGGWETYERGIVDLEEWDAQTPIECETPTKAVGEIIEKPLVGDVFVSYKTARDFYEKYGRMKGFSVVVNSSQRTQRKYDGITSYLFACIHHGSHDKIVAEDIPLEKRRPNTSTVRGGCQAHMRILLNVNTSEWVVRDFKDDHNHDFVPTPNKVLMKTSQTKLSEGVKCMVELFSKENLPVTKVTSILGGDVLGFTDRACWNHLRDVRQKLDVGDAQWKRQVENPQFYYAIQPDIEGRAVNFFWVDARSRLSYQQFGDVVTFDTTYKTNKYNLSFAPFTGINHHFQTIQFGCGLLQDETEASFVWLFETWKGAMGGVAPISMITDSDPAMRAAIPKVFPTTRHRLCYWHIKMKFGEKLAHLYFKKSPFKKEMKKCLKYTYRIEDFEKSWRKLMVKYELEQNSWLTGLYEDREAWVPVYNYSTFFGGMHTTGRSEGVNSFFKDYVTHTTSLKEFVEKLDQALVRIENRERAEDHKSEQKYRLLLDKSFMLKHAGDIYTSNMFSKFRSIWIDVELFKVDVDYIPDTYIVKLKCGPETDQWKVKLNASTLVGECECHYFEFVGLPCAHLMKVFSRLDLDQIPEYFIYKRWLKKANMFRIDDKARKNSENRTTTMRFSHLCREATQWACVAYQTEEGYKLFLDGIRDLGQKISEISISGGAENERVPLKIASEEIGEQSQPLLDPNVAKTKGRKKEGKGNSSAKSSGRFKHPIEIAQGKSGRLCHGCGSIQTHDLRNCPKRKKIQLNA
ncbi:hypothetical protein OROMI_011007 [Orobanche minor]